MKKQAKESVLGLLQSVEKAQLQPDFFDRLAPALLSRGILSSLGSAKGRIAGAARSAVCVFIIIFGNYLDKICQD